MIIKNPLRFKKAKDRCLAHGIKCIYDSIMRNKTKKITEYESGFEDEFWKVEIIDKEIPKGQLTKPKPYGKEFIMDLHECDTKTFTRKSIERYFKEVCDLIHMKRE